MAYANSQKIKMCKLLGYSDRNISSRISSIPPSPTQLESRITSDYNAILSFKPYVPDQWAEFRNCVIQALQCLDKIQKMLISSLLQKKQESIKTIKTELENYCLRNADLFLGYGGANYVANDKKYLNRAFILFARAISVPSLDSTPSDFFSLSDVLMLQTTFGLARLEEQSTAVAERINFTFLYLFYKYNKYKNKFGVCGTLQSCLNEKHAHGDWYLRLKKICLLDHIRSVRAEDYDQALQYQKEFSDFFKPLLDKICFIPFLYLLGHPWPEFQKAVSSNSIEIATLLENIPFSAEINQKLSVLLDPDDSPIRFYRPGASAYSRA